MYIATYLTTCAILYESRFIYLKLIYSKFMLSSIKTESCLNYVTMFQVLEIIGQFFSCK